MSNNLPEAIYVVETRIKLHLAGKWDRWKLFAWHDKSSDAKNQKEALLAQKDHRDFEARVVPFDRRTKK